LTAAEDVAEQVENAEQPTRIRSLDVARGLVIAWLLLSDIVFGERDVARHADWWGFTAYDWIFPAFLLLFGSSLAIAFRGSVPWPRLLRRTAVLLVAGLLFNMVTAWDASWATLRLTGVLQLFAVVGLVAIALTRPARRWWQALLVAGLLLAGHQALLAQIGSGCPSGLPEPGCNPSANVDPAVFGEPHLYHQMERGHDPEGLGVLPGATASALLGYAAGRALWARRRNAMAHLAGIGVACLAAAPILATSVPLNKRVWSPSVALLTAGITIGMLAVCHVLFDLLPDRAPQARRPLHVLGWVPEALGRNSLLMYFGFYALSSALANAHLGDTPANEAMEAWAEGIVAGGYPALRLAFFVGVAALLHTRGRYLTA
jgi:heparan-alpha-glucosaminide N-acetyltransferase